MSSSATRNYPHSSIAKHFRGVRRGAAHADPYPQDAPHMANFLRPGVVSAAGRFLGRAGGYRHTHTHSVGERTHGVRRLKCDGDWDGRVIIFATHCRLSIASMTTTTFSPSPHSCSLTPRAQSGIWFDVGVGTRIRM